MADPAVGSAQFLTENQSAAVTSRFGRAVLAGNSPERRFGLGAAALRIALTELLGSTRTRRHLVAVS